MQLVSQTWKLISGPTYEEVLRIIEEAGRTCYKSEDKITPTSAKGFVKRILASGHHSVIEHASITVRIITDRGVTHELVRHRLASYSQESTRYCNYGEGKLGMKFILPEDFVLDPEGLDLLWEIESYYNKCLANGMTPQQARYFLPNGLKTEIVVTMNIREWRHFFSLRASAKAHPQMKALAWDMLKAFMITWPVFFEDLGADENV